MSSHLGSLFLFITRQSSLPETKIMMQHQRNAKRNSPKKGRPHLYTNPNAIIHAQS